MLRRSLRFFEAKVEEKASSAVTSKTSSASSAAVASSTTKISARPTLEEAPYLLEKYDPPKPFISQSLLRSFAVSFVVGVFGVASVYWLMSHKITTEAMHRRRFIYSLAREEAEGMFGPRLKGYEDPYKQFVSPSCARYRDLVDQIEQRKRLQEQMEQEGEGGDGSRLLVDLRPKRPSGILSDAYHSSLLHETAVDSVKCLWNGCVENLQDALRTAVESWVAMREEDTMAAVQELARSHLGEQAVVVRAADKK